MRDSDTKLFSGVFCIAWLQKESKRAAFGSGGLGTDWERITFFASQIVSVLVPGLRHKAHHIVQRSILHRMAAKRIETSGFWLRLIRTGLGTD